MSNKRYKLIRLLKGYLHYLRMFSERYYRGLKTISDLDYDTIYEKAFKIGKFLDIDIYSVNFDKDHGGIKHYKPFLGLRKVYNIEDLRSWMNRTFPEQDFLLESKIDGLAVELMYIDGVLTSGITRGNGQYGLPITNNLNNFINLPQKINSEKGIYRIRGEAFIKTSDFQNLYNKKLINERSAVVSLLKNNILSKSLQFYPYDDNLTHKNRLEFINWIEKNNFLIHSRPSIINSSFNVSKLDIKELHDIKTDGVVIKTLNYKYKKTLLKQYDSIAFKDNMIKGISKVIDIAWNIGIRGLYTPVAQIEPIVLDSAVIQQCSLHNLNTYLKTNIRKNNQVLISRKGNIIPQIERVIKSKGANFLIPKKCYFCQTKLVKPYFSDTYLSCTNIFCSEVLYHETAELYKKQNLNIPGLSLANIKKLDIDNPYKIWDTSLEKFQSAIGVIQGKKIYLHVSKIKTISKNNILSSFFIHGLSSANVVRNISNFKSYLDFYRMLINPKKYITMPSNAIPSIFKNREIILLKLNYLSSLIYRKIIKPIHF